MIGNGYWYTGVTLRFHAPCEHGASVGASLEFFDSGFAQAGSTEGSLKLRYLFHRDEAAQHLRTLLDDAARLGLEPALLTKRRPTLYVQGDGEHAGEHCPDDWREYGARLADALGLDWPYGPAAAEGEEAPPCA